MKNKPIILRTIFVLLVIAIFAISIIPPTPRDFLDTFESSVKGNGDQELLTTIIDRTNKMCQENKAIYSSQALELVAEKMDVKLTQFIIVKDVTDNSEVIAFIKRKSAGSIRLGLDLNGGAEFLIKLTSIDDELGPDNEKPKPLEEDFDRYRDISIEIIRKRLESMKIYESEIAPAGSELISIKVPLASKEEKEKIKTTIQRAAKLRFCAVHGNSDGEVEKYLKDIESYIAPIGYTMMLEDKSGLDVKDSKNYCLVKKRYEMKGNNIIAAFPTPDEYGQIQISLEFNLKGAREFSKVTEANLEKRLAIVLDNKFKSAPVIKSRIDSGRASISGSFSREEAREIANVLVSGSLPVNLEIEAIFDTAPTLGRDNVESGLKAGTIALIAVMCFMFLYYLRAGLVANIALLVNIVLVLGALATFEATLTLPGIAGIILTMGMAVDANVLIFERIREELKKGRTLSAAIDMGYSRAFTTILDANLTTLFTALILMWQGTGPIKGFAVTLSVGIATSMFTALFLTRVIFDIMSRFKVFDKMKMHQVFNEPRINFLGMRHVTYIVSGILIIGTLVVVGIKRNDILGIDFTGGTQVTFDYDNENQVATSDVTKALSDSGYENAKAVYKANDNERKLEIVIKKSTDANKEQITEILNTKFPKAKFAGGSERTIGGLIGKEFRNAAIYAILMAVIGIVIYITIRFEISFAIAAIIAIIHDVIISVGVFLVCGRELSLPVIAALLTIIGYSLNDTIVVFDRIREDLGIVKSKTYQQIINISINQTLSRTLLTSVTTFIVLIILFFMGGIAINDFVFVMLVGVVVGTYSSIFVASPIVAVWHKRNIAVKEGEGDADIDIIEPDVDPAV